MSPYVPPSPERTPVTVISFLFQPMFSIACNKASSRPAPQPQAGTKKT